MPDPIPPYAGHAVRLREAAFQLGECLEGDVQVEQPDTLVAMLRATAIALATSTGELAIAADAAGQDQAAQALSRALVSQRDSAQAMAEAVQALSRAGEEPRR